jgi:transposase
MHLNITTRIETKEPKQIIMAGGRPSDYKIQFCEQIIEFGKEGMSKTEMCLELNICKQTMANWCEEHPEFLEAVKKAVDYSQGWWEKQGRRATFNSEGFNSTSYIFNMKNRFKEDWSDTSNNNITLSESLIINRTAPKDDNA